MIQFDIILFLSLLIAITPPIFLVRYVYIKYNRRPDQKKLIRRVFIFGVLFIIPTLSLEFLLSQFEGSLNLPLHYSYFFKVFFIAGFCEEFIKMIIILYFVYNRDEFDEFIDGIIFTIVVSLGFACLENVLYLLRGGLGMAILRTFTALPMHTIVAGIMGYYIGKAKFSTSRKNELILLYRGLFYAVLIHGLYDFLLSSNPDQYLYASIGILLLLLLIFLILQNKIKSALGKDLQVKTARL